MDKAALIGLAIWLASGLLNWLLAFKTPEQWEAFVVESPRSAALRKALRKIGFDLPGLFRLLRVSDGLRALQRVLAAKARLPLAMLMVLVLGTGACVDSAGQFDGRETLKVTRAAATAICRVIGVADTAIGVVVDGDRAAPIFGAGDPRASGGEAR